MYKTVLRNRAASTNIIEVGAFKGSSTCYLSQAASRVGKRVKSFELFSGLPIADPTLDGGCYVGRYSSDVAEYEANVRAYGRRDLVDLVIGDARQTLVSSLDSEGFSVAFLDADVYEVMRELLFQLWSIAKGGEIIICHDVNSKGVRKAVNEFHALSGNNVSESVILNGTTSMLYLPSLVMRISGKSATPI